jgi:CubicO group peptidase (beta-lactamase class C family)
MKKLILAGLVACSANFGQAAEPSSALPRSSPEAQGVASSAILAFVEAADRDIDSLHSFMLLRHGHVVAEGWWSPYGADSPHELYSLSKSFTSTAVGLAIYEGKLSLDDPVLKFFQDDAPAHPSERLKSMRVSDLLRMSTGQQTEPSVRSAPNWAKTFLAHPVPHKPGTHFLYNTSATYMLSAIVQKATGTTVLDYLRPRLFEPLGIEHPTWGTSPQGVTLGGYGLSVRSEDIARFGQFYLQKGNWHDKQIVPAAWVEAATARQTSNGSNPKSDWDQGYGYQFWRCRHGIYRGDGAFGQYCIVMPEQDAVIAITSGVADMQSVLNLVWDKLLPAMKPSPLADDADARKRLEQKLGALALPLPAAYASNEQATRVSGRTYRIPKDDLKVEAITLEYQGHGPDVTLIVRSEGVDRRIVCGRGEWRKGRFGIGGLREQPAAAGGAWTKDDTYTAKICLYETPFILTLDLRFEGDKLFFNSRMNVGFGPTRHPQLVGEAEKGSQDRDREKSGSPR